MGKMYSGTRMSLLSTPCSTPSLMTGHFSSYSDQLIWRVLNRQAKGNTYLQVRLACHVTVMLKKIVNDGLSVYARDESPFASAAVTDGHPFFV